MVAKQKEFANLTHRNPNITLKFKDDRKPEMGTAGNKKLSENFKKGGRVVYQNFVLLMKCVQVQFFATEESGRNIFLFVAKNCVNGIASNPPFLKLRQALMR